MTSYPHRRAFTLAEVLIALALLGIIVAFTIPKVMNNVGKQEAKSKVQETVSVLEDAWYGMKMRQELRWGNQCTDSGDFPGGTQTCNLQRTIISRLNFVEQSPNFSTYTTGCSNSTNSGSEKGYVIFPNGVYVQGLSNWGMFLSNPPNYGGINSNTYTLNSPICIDINGVKAPNLVGQDTFYGEFNLGGDFDLNGPRFSGYLSGLIGTKNFFWGDNISVPYMGNASPVSYSIYLPALTTTNGTVYSILQSD